MKMNLRNIERILDVLQFAVDHYGQTFMDEDIYNAYPKTTSNIINLLIERNVIDGSCKDGNTFDDNNFEDYRSFLSDLQDEIEDLDLPKEEKKKVLLSFNNLLNFNFNLLNAI